MSQLAMVGVQPLAIDVTPTFEDLLDKALTFGARLLGFAAILAIGWAISRLLGTLLTRLLRRLSFDRTAQRSGLSRWAGRHGPSGLMGRLAFYGLMLVALQAALSVFGANPVSNLLDAVIRWLPRALLGMVIVVLAAAIARAVFDMINRAVRGSTETALGRLDYGRVLARTAQILIISLGAVAALAQAGIGTVVTVSLLVASLATASGVIIVGVGGGLIGPMRDRWDRMLTRVDIERYRLEMERDRARHAERPTSAEPAAEPVRQPAAGVAGQVPAGQPVTVAFTPTATSYGDAKYDEANERIATEADQAAEQIPIERISARHGGTVG